jgi:hypothetical protein
MAGPEALLDEQKRLRRLRFVVDLTASVLYQEPELTYEDAIDWIERTEKAVTALFPGSETTFDLLIRPRLNRIVEERFSAGSSAVN